MAKKRARKSTKQLVYEIIRDNTTTTSSITGEEIMRLLRRKGVRLKSKTSISGHVRELASRGVNIVGIAHGLFRGYRICKSSHELNQAKMGLQGNIDGLHRRLSLAVNNFSNREEFDEDMLFD